MRPISGAIERALRKLGLEPAERDRGRKADELAVPERQLRRRPAQVAQHPEQCVALLEYASVFARFGAMPLMHLADHRIEVAAPRARRFSEQLDVLGEERHDGELPDCFVSALPGPVEEISPRPAPLALRWGEQQDVHGAGVVNALHSSGYARGVRTPSDELRVVVRPRRISAGDEVDRLEDVRLAGAVASHQRGDTCRKIAFRPCIAPEVFEEKLTDAHE